MADKATKTATDTLFVHVIVRFVPLRLMAYSDNPTGAAGALAGKDSALGGLGGGRKPGPGNRGDNEGAVRFVACTTCAILTHPQVSKEEEEKSSLKIRIQLDLDVEVHLTARVVSIVACAVPAILICSQKGDIVIGLL